MKKLLLMLFLLPCVSYGQIWYVAPVLDSTVFNFSGTDTLSHHVLSSHYIPGVVSIDTSSTTLWRIGNTLKPGFTTGTVHTHGIMTDTLNPYPTHANDYFKLKVGANIPNFIVDFWHRYDMDSLHAGGIIEFSTDSCSTWMNVASCTSSFHFENFYTSLDTILGGQAAFTGHSSGTQYSRFEVANCFGVKLTSTSCYVPFSTPVYFRFRFVSDTTTSTNSGWIIDSIKFEFMDCVGGTEDIAHNNTIEVSPNPAYSSITVTSANPIDKITITNLLGQQVYHSNTHKEAETIDVSQLPKGMYFISINNGEVRKFIKE